MDQLLDRVRLGDDQPGRSLFDIDLAATTLFVVLAVIAAAVPGPFRIPFAVVSCVLFGAGILAFLAAYARAVQRSRTDAINLTGLFGLSGSSPKEVQWRFHAMTAIQTVVSIATAAVRPFTAQAFGILVPMLGLGLGGLWAARHGVFGERTNPRARRQP